MYDHFWICQHLTSDKKIFYRAYLECEGYIQTLFLQMHMYIHACVHRFADFARRNAMRQNMTSEFYELEHEFHKLRLEF